MSSLHPRANRAPVAGAVTPLALAASLLLAAPAAHGQSAGSLADPCADLGSWAVVDAPPPPRGAPIIVGAGSPCADLHGQRALEPMIDVQVQIGGAGAAQSPEPVRPAPPGEAVTGTPVPPMPGLQVPLRQRPLRR